MMITESRTCNNCHYEVSYWWIHDAHDPRPVTQFVAVMLDDDEGLKGVAAVTDYCPKCGDELTLESTSKVA